MRRHLTYTFVAITILFVAALSTSSGRNLLWAAYTRIRGRYTVAERIEQCGNAARERIMPYFDRTKVDYPPTTVTFLVIKEQRVLQVYAGSDRESLQFIREYPIQGLSGDLGPKLREGDRQVPEGCYSIESLNPNSRFHLGLRLNYPNSFDIEMGNNDGRTDLGSDIMIHGGAASIGCLAMGDPVAEELFVLIADVGKEQATVIMTPVDFRIQPNWRIPKPLSKWEPLIYSNLRSQVGALPSTPANRSHRVAVGHEARE